VLVKREIQKVEVFQAWKAVQDHIEGHGSVITVANLEIEMGDQVGGGIEMVEHVGKVKGDIVKCEGC
jgi:hypothetical protein